MKKRILRSVDRKMFGGVASGLADYFDVDVAVVRIVFLAGFFIWGWTLFLYLFMWAVLPTEKTVKVAFGDGDYVRRTTEEPSDKEYDSDKTKMIFAFLLIAIGSVKLVEEFVPSIDLYFLAPAALIVCGAVLILKGGKSDK